MTTHVQTNVRNRVNAVRLVDLNLVEHQRVTAVSVVGVLGQAVSVAQFTAIILRICRQLLPLEWIDEAAQISVVKVRTLSNNELRCVLARDRGALGCTRQVEEGGRDVDSSQRPPDGHRRALLEHAVASSARR